tara:strand:+ start:1045 stop:1245 length:201 start_codon:yes stop_codon:yes gene_type:complete
MAKKKVKNYPDLVKDTATQAIINTNSRAFEARREQISLSKERENEIQNIKADIAEIKKLLKGLSKK